MSKVAQPCAVDTCVAPHFPLAGLELVALIRKEGVLGGKDLSTRPEGECLLSLVAGGTVQHVVAIKIDRLLRDCAGCLSRTKVWEKTGVALHIVDMGGPPMQEARGRPGDCLARRGDPWLDPTVSE